MTINRAGPGDWDAADLVDNDGHATAIRWVKVTDSSGTVIGFATAANQATQITAEQAMQATLGATTGAAVTTDANGTIQQYLRGLVKMLLGLTGPQTVAASLSTINVGNPGTLTNKSGTITSGGVAQTAIASNAARNGYMIQNQSIENLYFSTLAAAIAGQPSILLAPGQTYETPLNGFGTGALSVIGATTGSAFAAREW